MWIVAFGNAFDGITTRGPFNYEEALKYAEAVVDEDWESRVIGTLFPSAGGLTLIRGASCPLHVIQLEAPEEGN